MADSSVSHVTDGVNGSSSDARDKRASHSHTSTDRKNADGDISTAADAHSSTSFDNVTSSSSDSYSSSPDPIAYDWYEDPLLYDIIFEEDTAVETNMLIKITDRCCQRALQQQPAKVKAADIVSGKVSTTPASPVPPIPPLRCLEPACGSGRLLVSLAKHGWDVSGFDLSPGAVQFAQAALEANKCLRSKQMAKVAREKIMEKRKEQPATRVADAEKPEQRLSDCSETASSAADSSLHSASLSRVFVADMIDFLPALRSARPDLMMPPMLPSTIPPSAANGVEGNHSISGRDIVPTVSNPSTGFDVAHCLVSSVKHILDPADVLRHFAQIHAVLRSPSTKRTKPDPAINTNEAGENDGENDDVDGGGIYIIALHVHTLGGKDHFDPRVTYPGEEEWKPRRQTTETPAGIIEQTSRSRDDTVAVAHENAMSAASPSTSSHPSPTNISNSSSLTTIAKGVDTLDPTDVDDAFERHYERDSTKFKAQLITYQPDATTLIEKMIARVQLSDGEPHQESKGEPQLSPAESPTTSPHVAASSSPSASPSAPLLSLMSLRVYTLSTLHSLLCALSPLFTLAGVYSYSDIYDPDWDAAEYEIDWPFPTPDVEQLRAVDDEGEEEINAPTANGYHHSSPITLRVPRRHRNWNRLYRDVRREVRMQWEDVDAVVLVLRKKAIGRR